MDLPLHAACAAGTGAVAGAVATTAMSVLMAAWRVTAGGGRFGPAVVTDRTLGPAGVLPEDDVARVATRTVAHLAFGASVGAVYAVAAPPLVRAVPAARSASGPVRGAAYGLGVWAATYGGALPALGVVPPPPRDRPGRQPRLVAAHLVYGAVLGALCGRRPSAAERTGGARWRT